MADWSETGASPAWLEFGRLMVADLLVRAEGRHGFGAPDDDGGGDGDDDDGDELELDRALAGNDLIEAARSVLDTSLDVPSPFAIIVANAGLTSIEAAVLAIAVAIEADPSLTRLIARAQGRESPTNVTLGSLVTLLDGQRPDDPPVRRALLPDAALRRAGLLGLRDSADDGLFLEQSVVVPHGVVWAMLGDQFRDPALPPDREYFELDAESTGVSAGEMAGGVSVAVIVGGGRRLRRVEAASRCAGLRFVACTPPESESGWQALVRDATISGRTALLEIDAELSRAGREWIDRAGHLAWGILSPRDVAIEQLPTRPWSEYRIDARDPTDDEWRSVLGDDVPRTHPLTHDQLDSVGRVLPAVHGDLDQAVRRLVSGRLEQLATRIRPTRGWDDIVLSPDRLTRLRSIADRYRLGDTVYGEWGFSAYPSRGLVAAFSGPSGTGKTLATEIIAGELGLDVFKLDLSSIVSKYIGETEKNLEEIFEAAAAGDLVLFFDEADALFGKRSEVRDARDRYANIEVSYLLQRLERYDGVVILATNLEKNIDDAFLRRIQIRVEFALPGPDERRGIWARNFPDSAPTEGVDLDWLVERFEFSGASIRNAAVHAAFLAAAAGSPITMPVAVAGVAEEFRKLGRLVRAEEFGEYFAAVTGTKRA